MFKKFFYLIKFFFRIIRYLLSPTKRYSFLLLSIFIRRPKTILEIGVYNGKRAIEMIETAKIFNNEISYFGFDLFEDFYKKKGILKNELSKSPLSVKKILSKLGKFKKIKLIKGDTNKTLPLFVKNKQKIDFVFIDGGHSLKTIENDWNNLKGIIGKKTIILFDDFYEFSLKKNFNFGCNKIIESIKKNKTYNIKKFILGDNFFDTINLINKKIFMIRVTKND